MFIWGLKGKTGDFLTKITAFEENAISTYPSVRIIFIIRTHKYLPFWLSPSVARSKNYEKAKPVQAVFYLRRLVSVIIYFQESYL